MKKNLSVVFLVLGIILIPVLTFAAGNQILTFLTVGGTYTTGTNNSDQGYLLAGSAGASRIAQGPFYFENSGTLSDILVPMEKVNNATDTVTLWLYHAFAGSDPDSGSLVASSTLVAADIQGNQDYTATIFHLNVSVPIIATYPNPYWLVFTRSVPAADRYYDFAISTNDPYHDTDVNVRNYSGSWNAPSNQTMPISFFSSLGDVFVPVIPGTTATTVDCSEIDDGTFLNGEKLGCEIRKALGWFIDILVVPSQESQDYVSSSFADFQDVIPFNFFFGTIDLIQDAVADYDDSGLTLTLGTSFPNADLTNDTSNTITILNPSTLEDRFGSTVTNWWFNIILMLATVLLAWGIFKVIYHPH